MVRVLLFCILSVAVASPNGNRYLPLPSDLDDARRQAVAEIFSTSAYGSTAIQELSGSNFIPNPVLTVSTTQKSSAITQFGDKLQTGNGNKKKGKFIKILQYQNDHYINGYNFSYETENGIRQSEEGFTKQIGNTNPITVQGSYSYVSPEGLLIAVEYVADEFGFRVLKNHIKSPKTLFCCFDC